MKIYTLAKLSNRTKQRLFERAAVDLTKIRSEVWPLMQQVKQVGDQAILGKYAERQLPITELAVSAAEFARAQTLVSADFLTALNQAKRNLETVCRDQRIGLTQTKSTWLMDKQVEIWREWRPFASVGVYAPGGRANYPSSVLMGVVPALAAGCPNICLCVPPRTDGTVPAEVLVTARALGISRVYKVGGPQAIAALAYGTQSIPKCDLIVGPGNQYVTAAKLNVYPETQIDMPAGPSENLIIADESAPPTWVAADLITDCEHGPDSTGVLLTPSPQLAQQVAKAVQTQLRQLSTATTIRAALKNFGAIIVVDSLAQAIELANEYAPEHLQIMTRRAKQVATQITAAGSVFVGPYSAKAAGDYCTGANHILPTGGLARIFGPQSVENYGRYIEFQRVSRSGLARLTPTIRTYAMVEELPAHGQSAAIRRPTARVQ